MTERRAVEPLDVVMTYENERVVRRFCIDHDLPHGVGFAYFEDLKRYLWLSAMTFSRPDWTRVPLFPWQRHLDGMWHTFLLFTHDYGQFCERFLGGFVHHEPASDGGDPANAGEEAWTRDDLAGVVRLVAETLGIEVAKRWFLRPGAQTSLDGSSNAEPSTAAQHPA